MKVQTTIPICFFCGEERNEVVISEKLVDDNVPDLPSSCIIDYTPCEHCQEQMEKGVTFVEVQTEPISNFPPAIAKGGEEVYMTSRWCVVTASHQMCKDLNLKKGDKCFVDKETFDWMNDFAKS